MTRVNFFEIRVQIINCSMYNNIIKNRNKLSSLKLPQLKDTALKYGLLVSGTKSQLISRIQTHLSNTRMENSRVLAIDVGLVNLSYISAETHHTCLSIHDWSLIDMKLSNYDPVYYAIQIQKLLDDILIFNPTNIIIEAQSWRSGLRIPHTILKLKSLEAILIGCIISRGYNNVDLISPKKVSDYLTSIHSDFEQGKYRVKKASSIKLVETLLQSVEIKGECSNVFRDSRKKDDLADSFLLAFVWNEWRKNAIMDKSERKYS